MTAPDMDDEGGHCGSVNQRTGHGVTILADDLTGAGDAVVQFRLEGWPALLQLGDAGSTDVARTDWAAEDDHAVAVARTLDSRAMSHENAFAITREAAQRLGGDDSRRLYLKIDSTMRGSVAAQVEGALSGWQHRHPGAFAIVCPAYPAMGRTVVEGVVRIGDQPLEDSPAGTDPVTPVATSVLTDLLPGSTWVPMPDDRSQFASHLAHAADMGSGIVVVDAADESALEAVAAAVAGLGAPCVAVGSAGLSRHLARAWAGTTRPTGSVAAQTAEPRRPVGHRLVVGVSSRNAVSDDQMRHLAAAESERVVVVELDGDDVADGGFSARRRAAAAAGSGADIVVVTLAPPVPQNADGTGTVTPVTAVPAAAAASAAAHALGHVVSHLASDPAVGALLLVGGDGARAALQALGATGVVIDGQAAEGVPVGSLLGGIAAGTVVATKAGGFGARSTLTDVVHHLEKTRKGLR